MIDEKSTESNPSTEELLKDYVLKTVLYTSIIAIVIFAIAYIIDRGHKNLLNLLFPFIDSSYPDVIGIVWIIVLLILISIRFTKYRSKLPLVALLYLYAFFGLATLTTAVIASGGIEYSPLAAFFPVAISINIMSTSSKSWIHRTIFFVFTASAVIVSMKYNVNAFIDPLTDTNKYNSMMDQMNSVTRQTVYYITFVIAISIGFIAGLISRKSP